MRIVESLSEAIESAHRREQTMTRCPAHDDGNASLHVTYGDKHPVLMTCHAGCSIEAIIAEGNVDPQSLMAPRDDNDVTADGVWTPAKDSNGRPLTASHIYPYYDEEGQLLFEVLRIPEPGGKKTFRQRHPDSTERSGWKWNMEGVRRVLYRLPEVLAAKRDGVRIWVVEGEKDVETLRRLGEVATTSPMGAGNGKWLDEYTEMLAGATVTIVPDADATGRAHARVVREALVAAGCAVSVKEAMNGCKDITDHFGAGGSMATLIETVPEQQEAKTSYGLDILEAIKRTVTPASFVVPGVLARGDRLLVTGFEGHGKSTLLRQMGVMCAAGIHPWTLNEMPPQKVLFIDSENHPDQVLESWQHMIGLASRLGRPVEEGQLILLEEWDNDIDLTSDDGHDWMMERIHAYQPDIVCMGPLYNLSSKDLSEHAVVGRLKQVVNEARSICGSAFIMEHHAPHRGPGDKERSVRPYGSSTFLKWPDFGFGLRPTETEGVYEWQKTRFPRVRSRHFPSHMRWGKPESLEFPWMPAIVAEDGTVY
jgi:replicative DNA helicase